MAQRASKQLLAVCVFLGALLLFLLEPLVAKSILPWFGGGASVWTTCMLFFQVVLLAGYTYAHLGATRLGRKSQFAVHLALIVLAIVMLPVIPPERLRPVGEGAGSASPIAQVLLVLLFTVGMPFLVLSATGTLVQTWWARLHPDSPPYRLYALSNAGSLAGLLLYPLVVEPLLGLRIQAWVWSAAMVVFGLLCAICAWLASSAPVIAEREPGDATDVAPISPWRVLAWIVLPMIPSVMLLAVTAALTQHVAPIPFLWILPLTLYLLSFICCFEYPQLYRRGLFVPIYGASMLVVSVFVALGTTKLPLPVQLIVYSLLLFSGCMIGHGELYRLRPPSQFLSRFYLALALGGALGGVFAAVIAPLVFTGMWELHLSIIAGALVCLGMMWGSPQSILRRGRPTWAWFLISLTWAMAAAVLWLDISGGFLGKRLILRDRSFYGTLAVLQTNLDRPGEEAYVLLHGGIIHGLQLQDPKRWQEPLSYYWPRTGIGTILQNPADAPRHIGVVGLGAGAVAVYARPGDRLTTYEINPQVVRIAQGNFTFLRNTPARVTVIEGDGRISLERQENQGFDVLMLDAFSGDSVPVHLLTREAMELYARHLKPDGILAVNITNSYLNLEPVVARAAETLGFETVIADTPPESDDGLRYHAVWALLSRSHASLDTEALRAISRPARTDNRVDLWTDDRSNLLRILY